MADQRIEDLTAITYPNLAIDDSILLWDLSDGTGGDGTYKQMVADWFERRAVKTSQQDNSSNTTLADVTGLGFTVEASKTYVVEWNLFAISAATTTGLVCAVNGPTIGSGVIRYAFEAATSATARFQGGANAYDTAIVSTGMTSTSLPTLHRMVCYFKAGATGGTLALRMRSEISGSNASIMEGSYGILRRVA